MSEKSANNKQSICQRSSWAGSSGLLLLALVSFAMFIQIEGQFFTKSNSKSIPRMGRRSDLAPAPTSFEQRADLRRQLIDLLLAKLGPNATIEGGEIASVNDQPFDEQQADNSLESQRTSFDYSYDLLPKLAWFNKAPVRAYETNSKLYQHRLAPRVSASSNGQNRALD